MYTETHGAGQSEVLGYPSVGGLHGLCVCTNVWALTYIQGMCTNMCKKHTHMLVCKTSMRWVEALKYPSVGGLHGLCVYKCMY